MKPLILEGLGARIFQLLAVCVAARAPAIRDAAAWNDALFVLSFEEISGGVWEINE